MLVMYVCVYIYIYTYTLHTHTHTHTNTCKDLVLTPKLRFLVYLNGRTHESLQRVDLPSWHEVITRTVLWSSPGVRSFRWSMRIRRGPAVNSVGLGPGHIRSSLGRWLIVVLWCHRPKSPKSKFEWLPYVQIWQDNCVQLSNCFVLYRMHTMKHLSSYQAHFKSSVSRRGLRP